MTTQEKINELTQTIEQLMRAAETGEQWAEICRLEAELVAETCRQFGVPYTVKG